MPATIKQEPVDEGALVKQEASSPGVKQEPLHTSGSMLAARAAAAPGPYPQWPSPTAAACHAVVERLAAMHGLPSRQRAASGGAPQVGCEEKRTVLDSLVRTLLSQNTTDTTSGRAFASLKERFPSWQQVAAAPLPELADSIRVGGLADIKATRIQAILHTLAAERGEMSLEHLRAAAPEAVHSELGRFKGVGKKTIACVQLFALERPDFAVDTHVWEITKTLGWAPSNCSRDQAYDHLNARVPDELKYDLHVLLVRHGKACPACAKAGSAKAASAAAKAVDCPLADFKPPRSQLQAASPAAEASRKGKVKQQQRRQGEEPAGAAGKERKKGDEAATGAAAAPEKSKQRRGKLPGGAAGGKRRKVEAGDGIA